MIGGEKVEYVVFILCFIIVILICLIIEQKRNYDLEITKKNRKISSITSEYNFYKNEYEKRKDIVEINYEVTSADKFMPLNKLEYTDLSKLFCFVCKIDCFRLAIFALYSSSSGLFSYTTDISI